MVRALGPDEWSRWDRFVSGHPLGSVYHTAAWQRIIRHAYGHEPLYAVIERNGAIVAGLATFCAKSRLTGRRLISVPGAQACDPLVNESGEYATLVEWALRTLRDQRARSLELRTTARFEHASPEGSTVVSSFHTHRLPLEPDLDQLERALHHDSIRRRVRRAVSAGLGVEIGETTADVGRFYALYLAARKQLGLLPQPLRLFEAMWSELHPSGRMQVMHARHGRRIVSSLVLLNDGNEAVFESGASDPDFMHLGASPLLLWEAIKRSKAAGMRVFDFGRTAGDNVSLASFKKKWGAIPEPLNYLFLPTISKSAALRDQTSARRAMALVLRSSPTPVCAAMGRLLYPHLV